MIRSKTFCLSALLSVGATTPAFALQDNQGCRVTAEPTRRIELPDGRTVSTNVKSIARSGGTIMALGGQAYVFAAGAGPRDDVVMRDTIIGFTIDARGAVAVVPNPPGIARAFHARVAAAPDSAFHVLFATTEPDPLGIAPTSDTATVWYARFRHGEWTGLQRITTTRGVYLDLDLASELIEHHDDLAAVFPFEAASSQGLILLHRVAGQWRADTLRTREPSKFVDAAYTDDGTIVAAFTLPGRELAPWLLVGLFEARFGTSWSAPRLIGGSGRTNIAEVRLVRNGPDVVASWIQWTTFVAETSVLYQLTLGSERPPSVVDAGKHTFPYDIMSLGDGRPVWLTRGPLYGTTLNVRMNVDSSASPATFNVPFENPRTASVALDRDRVLALTMKQGHAPDEPMVASFATILQFRCPEPERRQ